MGEHERRCGTCRYYGPTQIVLAPPPGGIVRSCCWAQRARVPFWHNPAPVLVEHDDGADCPAWNAANTKEPGDG